MKEQLFSDLFDIPALQKLLDDLYLATGVPTEVLDPDGRILTASGWQDICTKFYGACKEAGNLCRKSDAFMKEHLHEDTYVGYQCENGLVSYAYPIMVEGEHEATLLAGQVFHEPPDEEFFRAQAGRYGFDEGEYIEALRRVPVMDTSRIKHVMEFLRGMADLLSETALKRLEESRRKDEKIARNEQLYRSLVQRLSSVVWTTDAEGRFVLPQDSWFAYTGQPWEAHRDFGWVKMLHPDDRQRIQGIWSESLRLRRSYEASGRLWCAAKSEFRHFVVRAIPVISDDEAVEEWVGTVTDVHELKIADEALRERADALEAANKELAQFAYVASHDLREPLRKISSFTELLAKRYRGQLDEKAERYIYYIVDAAHRMQHLIEGLLTLSRIGTTELAPQPVNLGSALELALNDLEPLLVESGGKVTQDPLPTVYANPSQMGQLLQNLIANAVKFMGDAPPRIHVTSQVDEDECVVSVRDNGIGLDMEHAERIFGIFQRLHGRGERAGAGIGLAVCKKIVQRHGGRIWVESEAGKGAIFRFTFPADKVVIAGKGEKT